MAKYDLTELGATGLQRYSGLIFEEILPELSGFRWRRIVRQMIDNDPVIASILFAIEMLVRQADWDIQAASDATEDQQAADFIRGALFEDMSQPWPDVVSEILSFLPWGWSFFEVVYKRRLGESSNPQTNSRFTDGRVGWRKWAIRAQETLLRWEFDEEGGVQALTQNPPPDFRLRTIPIDKALLFRTSVHKGNPEGRSIIRGAYTAWYYKSNIQRIEGIGIERDLAGLPVIYCPPELLASNAPAADVALLSTLKDIATNIRRDEQEGLVFPLAYNEQGKETYKVELLSTGGQRSFDTDKIISRYDQRILMSVMADFLMLGHQGKTGSFALSTSKTELFSMALGAWLDSICATINRHAIPRLLSLNGIRARAPQLTHGSIESFDLKELGDYIAALSGAGVALNDEQQRFLLEQANVPVPAETESADAKPKQEPEPVKDKRDVPVSKG